MLSAPQCHNLQASATTARLFAKQSVEWCVHSAPDGFDTRTQLPVYVPADKNGKRRHKATKITKKIEITRLWHPEFF
jgi:hypothetical protein